MLKVQPEPDFCEQEDIQLTLDELAHKGARKMLIAALKEEVAAYIERHAGERDSAGHRLVVRNGRGQSRKVTCGAGVRRLTL